MKYLNKLVYACPKCWSQIAKFKIGKKNIEKWTCNCEHRKPAVFDSVKEYTTGLYLRGMEKDGKIAWLKFHPRYGLAHGLSFEADFLFFDMKRGEINVDVKALNRKTRKPFIHNPEMFFLKLRLMRDRGDRVEVWTAVDGSQVWELDSKGKKLKLKEKKI